MSETEQNKQPAAAEPANLPTVAPVVIKQSGGKALAVGALVLAILGLGASGFIFVQGQNVLKNQELAFNQKINQAGLGNSANAGLLNDSLRKQNELMMMFDRLSAGQKQNSEQIAQANRAYQELLKGRANWLVDEVEATLNLASQQLLLSGNVPVAVTVLENIDSRLNRFEQAELLPIKQAISSDLAALKSRPYLDVAGASLRLDRLESAVSGLPLTIDSTLQPGKAPAAPADNPNAGWWQRTWQKTLHSLRGLVEVRKLDNSDTMLLSPDQIFFVRENLRLRLLDARAALMQHNGEVYQSDLSSAEAAVKQYFDNASPATQSWLKELAELKSLDVRMVSSDALKASLLAVRNYQNTVRPMQNVVAPELPASAPAVTPAGEQKASAPAEHAASATSPKEPETLPSVPAAPASAPVQKASEPAKAKGEAA